MYTNNNYNKIERSNSQLLLYFIFCPVVAKRKHFWLLVLFCFVFKYCYSSGFLLKVGHCGIAAVFVID